MRNIHFIAKRLIWILSIIGILGLFLSYAWAEDSTSTSLLTSPSGAGNGIDEPQSFESELSLLGLDVNWTAYGWFRFTHAPNQNSLFELQLNPVINFRSGKLVVECEFEIEEDEVAMEYAVFDYMFSRSLELRTGLMLYPVGQFNDRYHVSFRWNMISRPLMFKEVVPEVFSGIGVQARGVIDLNENATLEYTSYIVNGLGHDSDFIQSQDSTRDLRMKFGDVNQDKAVGARLGINLFADKSFGATLFDISAYTGAINPSASQRLTILDAALTIKLLPFLVRSEFAQTYLGPDSDPLMPFQHGFYTEVSYKHDNWDLSSRWDYADTLIDEPLSQHRLAFGVLYQVAVSYAFRAEINFPLNGATRSPSYSGMFSFSL